MDNPQTNESGRWTERCAALLEPPADWEPNANAARARFEARLNRPPALKRYLLLSGAVAALACFALVAIPLTSAFAQQAGNNHWYGLGRLWYWVTVVRPMPIFLRSAHFPQELSSLSPQPLTEPGPPPFVPDAAEAARLAGFVPRFPAAEFAGKARLSVLKPMSFATVIRTADLEKALSGKEVVPHSWDGARLVLNIGPTVAAELSQVSDQWSELTLIQGRLPSVDTPSGFDLTAFNAVNLRATGRISSENAIQLAARTITAPALLFGNRNLRNGLAVHEVSVHSGTAMLIEDLANGGMVETVTLIWSVHDRMYVLKGVLTVPCSFVSLDMAGAVVSVVEIANLID